MIVLDEMFGSSEQEHEEDLLRGLAASGGAYEGTARRVAGPTSVADATGDLERLSVAAQAVDRYGKAVSSQPSRDGRAETMRAARYQRDSSLRQEHGHDHFTPPRTQAPRSGVTN